MLNISNNDIVQASELFIQAAGSDNNNSVQGIVEGIHLRWTFKGHLGDHHLPKGDLERSTSGYNKPDDYVKIYRATFGEETFFDVNFNQSVNNSTIRKYPSQKTIEFDIPYNESFVTAELKFLNGFGYSSGNVANYLNSYGGVVELKIKDHLMFRVDINLNGNGLEVETISVNGNDDKDLATARIIGRQTINNSTPTIEGDNIYFVRFKPFQKSVSSIRVNTYRTAIESHNWTSIGDFSLTTDDNVALDALKATAIDRSWPKYNDGATINASNYQTRWTNQLKAAVGEYINLSVGSTKAKKRFKTSEETPTQINFSYLDGLNLVSMDYHVARMLGLGHIDDSEDIREETKYIYLAEYIKSIEGNSVTLYSMSLPTSKLDYRLPPAPQLEDMTYGLKVNTHTNQPIVITDDSGYLPYEPARFININRGTYQYEEDYTATFFAQSNAFSGEGQTLIRPISYGVEYRRQGGSFIRPELNNDKNYLDSNNHAETITVLAGRNPIYNHKETQAGIHEYAIYGVNWFSRASDLSNIRATDNTTFPKPNTLLPPINLGVQYIQKESPLLFTSQNEQNQLVARSNLSNPNFLRVTFDWNYIQHSAYQQGDYAQFYFRTDAAKKVRGEIASITEIGNHQIEVQTKAYTLASLQPTEVVSPVIPSNELSDYIGGVFAVKGEHYLVENVQFHSSGAIFTLKQNKNRIIQEIENNQFTGTETYSSPEIGTYFTVLENLVDKNKWKKLNKRVQLKAPTSHKETIQNDDGTTSEFYFGGIIATGNVTNEGNGVYKVTFNSDILPAITDTDVEWHKGIARMKILGSTERKSLDCWSIGKNKDGTGNIITNSTVLYLYDSNPGRYTTSEPWQEEVQTGSNIEVNFHPGYRVYIYPENESNNTIDWNAIEPVTGSGSNITYLAACSVDTTINPQNLSPLSTPAQLLALELSAPKQPKLPIGPTFATRPDFYGKSSFTFDTELVSEHPYALLFYRASERAILDQLYLPDTIVKIYNDLAAIKDDEFSVNRWQAIINIETEGDDFMPYGEYGFPRPDNDKTSDNFNGDNSVDDIKENILDALSDAFLSLTRQPVVYDYLNNGYQTSNKAPVLRNSNNELLLPSDTAFNPFPMACITNNSPKEVRFTDYSLDGASKHIYFYCIAELSDKMKLSANSPILGPIQLVNAFPVETPVIKQVLTQMEDSILGLSTGVRFVLDSYTSTEEEQIKQVRIYRAYDIEDTYSVRTMTLVDTVDYSSEVIDTFRDVEYPPFGEMLYYRLVALRAINNEKNETEYIPSKPSKVVMTNIIDVNNPIAPAIEATIGTNTGEHLQNVTLTWSKVTHNGSYSLYKMNNVGNWVKIYDIKTNDRDIQYPPLINGSPDFSNYTETRLLDKTDEEDNTIYHRFKVVAENASGLLTIRENILVVSEDIIGGISTNGMNGMEIGNTFIIG